MLTLDVWSDVLCPWCYIGEAQLDRAIENFSHADRVKLRVHTFQLEPEAPTQVRTNLEHIAEKLGMTEQEAGALEAGTAARAHALGLPYSIDRTSGNTFDMLRLVHLGNQYGVGFAFLRAMRAEVFRGNPAAFEAAALTQFGVALGIPSGEITSVLTSDRYADAVHADHDHGVRLGARGVPFMLLAEKFAVPGAVDSEQMTAALEQVWKRIYG